ncbi:unnamed protein product, partial [Amoebophrya sp. A120]
PEYPKNCPQDCELDPWVPGDCSETCGDGVRTFTRQIRVPPAYEGAACGNLTKTEPCKEKECPVHCELHQWSSWGACDTTCGPGVQTRT